MPRPRLPALRAAAALQAAQALLLCHGFDLRVAKGHHSRGYGFVRLSVVSEGAEEVPTPGGWQWERPFQRRWTNKTLRSSVVAVPPAGTLLRVGGEDVFLKLPAPGAGVTGFLLADVCFSSRGGVECPNGRRFKVLDRLVEVVNTLMESGEFDFWGMLGNNFYDRDGELSSEFFNRLTTKAKSKPFLTVPGNRDFWIGGAPPGDLSDQLGFGHAQFYGQDTAAGQREAPYELEGGGGLELAAAENFVFGTQLGDVAFFGYAGSHDWDEVEPHTRRFCNFAGMSSSVRTVVVLGHWSVAEDGCKAHMDVRSVYNRMKDIEGCGEKRMLYFMGHEHCNRATWDHQGSSPSPVSAQGFVVGGAGMRSSGCSEFGFTVVQSDPYATGGPNVRVDHFPIAWDDIDNDGQKHITDRYDWLIGCLKERGYAGCRMQHGLSFRATSEDDIVAPMLTVRSTATSTTTTATATSTTTGSSTTTSSRTGTSTRTTTTTTTAAPAVAAAAAPRSWTLYFMVVFPAAVAGGFLATLTLLGTSLSCKWLGKRSSWKHGRPHMKVSSRDVSREAAYAKLDAGDRKVLASSLVHHASLESEDEGDAREELETPGFPSRAENTDSRTATPRQAGGPLEASGAAPGNQRMPSKPNY